MKLFLLPVILLIGEIATSPCVLREYKTGLVCVCTAIHCDTFEFQNPSSVGDVVVISTSRNGLRFKESKFAFNNDRAIIFDRGERNTSSQTSIRVTIDRNQTYQKILGFGNAFTGTVSHILKLAPELSENIFRSYFSKNAGNDFNIIRVPIGGCDFDLQPWAYNESPQLDRLLSNFTKLDPRDVQRNEQIKRLMEVSGNFDLKFLGSAWSSPRWMKTNNDWTGFSALKEEFFQTWADYHVKFLTLMKNDGIDFWAITTGNEPLNGVSAFLFIHFMSLGWLPRWQGKWVAENLGPALKNSSNLSNVKILAGDDQRYTMPWWFNEMYKAHPQSKNFVAGHAVHWYWDKFISANRLDQTHEKYPDKLIVSTEACAGDKPWEEHRPLLGYWPRAEDYAVDILQDLNHHVNAWIDWNMLLDLDGGPNYAKNFVDSAIIVNTTSGTEFYKQPMFYALGHFSRFLIPDSVRIKSSSSSEEILLTAFERPDGLTAIVLYNTAEHDIDVDLSDPQRGLLKLNFPAKSINSLLYQ